MNGEGSLEETRRKLERLLGYPPGAFDPASSFLRDMERVNKALGEGFEILQAVINPQQLLDRIEALHPDQAPLRLRKAAEDILNLPRKIWEIKPPGSDGFMRRY